MRRVRLTGPAQQDIARALRRSEENFGKRARDRYRRLLDRALRDLGEDPARNLGEDPARTGVKSISDLREGYSTFHIKSTARRASKPSVRQPRHLIAFYVDESGDVIVARVFHERQMLSRHLTADD